MISDQQHAKRGDQIRRRWQITAGVNETHAGYDCQYGSDREQQRRVFGLVEIEHRLDGEREDRPIEHRSARAFGSQRWQFAVV